MLNCPIENRIVVAAFVILAGGFCVLPAASQQAADAAPSFQAYSRFDFVPGEKIIAIEDFAQDSIGDFPAKWNTNAAGEIVTIAGKPGRWLKLTRPGVFIPELAPVLPENFTLEFDLLTSPSFDSGGYFNASLVELSKDSQPAAWQSADNRFTFTAFPHNSEGESAMEPRLNGVGVAAVSSATKQFMRNGNAVHISISRQRERVRVYFNQDKLWDVPRALLASARYNSIIFFVPNVEAGSEYFLGNVRLAVGAPDTRNKLLTEGKWVTRGILFEVNSDRVKPESYGAMREIANVLKENADVKVQIVGHTDADGEAAKNLDLSKRRAAAVRGALTKEFAIAENRMDTDGKGSSQPVDKNDTAAGKANNRRVEFIKK